MTYLIGAGASEGALRFEGSSRGILMENLQDEITIRLAKERNKAFGWAQNQLASGANLERLISLYEYSGLSNHLLVARKLRKIFREVLLERINAMGKSFVPNLLVAMLDMHQAKALDEEIVAILTTNYEDLLERSIQRVFGGINLPINVKLGRTGFKLGQNIPPLLKMHGSFNWKSVYPIALSSGSLRKDEGIWIPPGIAKRKELYPFNIIWGKAREYLNCNVLRVIGSSLSLNDWDLVALISISQNFNNLGSKPLTIELIDWPRNAESLTSMHHYLNVNGLHNLPEFRDYIARNYLPSGVTHTKEQVDSLIWSLNSGNPFEMWLRAKGEGLLREGKSLQSKSGEFERFIMNGLGGANL